MEKYSGLPSGQNAKFITGNEYGLELRLSKPGDCWPGYGYSLPYAGYWIGSFRKHKYLGGDLTKINLDYYMIQLPKEKERRI